MTRLVRVLDCRIMIEDNPEINKLQLGNKLACRIAHVFMSKEQGEVESSSGGEGFGLDYHSYIQEFPDDGPLFNHDDAKDDLSAAYRPVASHAPSPGISTHHNLKALRRLLRRGQGRRSM